MADKANKVVAIYGNHQLLKSTLDDLNQAGFSKDEISVLVKQQPDDTEFGTDEVRAYSTATYPSTLERTTVVKDELLDRPVLGRDLEYTDPLLGNRSLGYDAIPGIDTTTTYNRDVVVDRDIVVDRDVVVDRDMDENRLDKNIAEENDVAVKDPSALIKDSMKGGALGLLAGAAALLIPGIGPVMAAGPIAAAIAALATGAAVGTTAGALVGLFQDEGIPSDRVDTYRAAFEAGKGIIIIKPKSSDDMSELNMARSILNRHNPEMVEFIS